MRVSSLEGFCVCIYMHRERRVILMVLNGHRFDVGKEDCFIALGEESLSQLQQWCGIEGDEMLREKGKR